MPPSAPVMPEAALTTTDSQKLRKPQGFRFPYEPTDEEVADTAEEEHPVKKWTSYVALDDWVRNCSTGLDHNAQMEDSGWIHVGTLRNTIRSVYAAFVRDASGEVETDTNGCARVRLLVGPFDHTSYFGASLAKEDQLTDQHGLSGFHACGEVLDWSVVKFDDEIQGRSLPETYDKVVKSLRTHQ